MIVDLLNIAKFIYLFFLKKGQSEVQFYHLITISYGRNK